MNVERLSMNDIEIDATTEWYASDAMMRCDRMSYKAAIAYSRLPAINRAAVEVNPLIFLHSPSKF